MYGSPLYSGISPGQNLYITGIVSDDALGKPTVIAPTKTRLREYPPLRLSINVATPDGHTERWASTAYDPKKAVSGLSFSSTIPGGFEHADMTLVRDTRRDYSDLEELETLTIQGVGGEIAWQGRLETIPSVSGDQIAITPGAVGYQSHLADDNSVRELYADIDLSKWQAASVQRKINLLHTDIDLDDASARGEPSGQPAVDCELSGPWSRPHWAEGWYDAKGVPIGKFLYGWQQGTDSSNNPILNPVDGNWNWQAGLSSDDVASSWWGSGNLRSAGPGSGTVTPGGNTYWAFVQLFYNAAGGTSGVLYDLYWTTLALYGTHGLTTYTTVDGTQGLLGSDILGHAIPKYAPKLSTTFAGHTTIIPSSFVIPQLVYLDPVTASQVIKDVTSFELQDWAVWEGPTFWWYPRNSIGRKWRARIGPTRLQQAGPQIDRLWNGVVVQFSDVLGVTRTVGPPGSGAQITDSGLIDADPMNPINEVGIRKWAPLQMSGVSTTSAAIQIGKIFLEEQKILNTSGSAGLTGYVEDSNGVTWPAWMVRGGDQISFIDAADTSYRRIISANYSDDSKVNAITLDTPPDSLQAILARLQVVLAPITGG